MAQKFEFSEKQIKMYLTFYFDDYENYDKDNKKLFEVNCILLNVRI